MGLIGECYHLIYGLKESLAAKLRIDYERARAEAGKPYTGLESRK
jgi:hypothetical protein